MKVEKFVANLCYGKFVFLSKIFFKRCTFVIVFLNFCFKLTIVILNCLTLHKNLVKNDDLNKNCNFSMFYL